MPLLSRTCERSKRPHNKQLSGWLYASNPWYINLGFRLWELFFNFFGKCLSKGTDSMNNDIKEEAGTLSAYCAHEHGLFSKRSISGNRFWKGVALSWTVLTYEWSTVVRKNGSVGIYNLGFLLPNVKLTSHRYGNSENASTGGISLSLKTSI